jgi:hypothetical protein
MRTHRVGTIEIDEARLRDELAVTNEFHLTSAYQEFVCGTPSKDVMLWAPGSDAGDGVIAHYDQILKSGVTEYGERLPYLSRLIEQHYETEHIRFARLAFLSSMVHVPHRDYVEFKGATPSSQPAHRLHMPLITNPACLFTEDNLVYRMKVGEVWFLDVTREHGSAALTDEVRIHLIIDFVDVDDVEGLVRVNRDPEPVIPPQSLVDRPKLTDAERAGLFELAAVVDKDNLKDVLGILAKKQYRRDGGEGFFWNTVDEIARRVADPALSAELAGMRKYFMVERDE